VDWVKLLTGYFRDTAIAIGDDAMEVMFTRGLAYCGEAETGGFIPDAIVPSLTRRPAQGTKVAARLVTAEVWEKDSDRKLGRGYRVINWHKHQAELERIVEKKVRDAERKRKKRAQDREMSTGLSADTVADSPRLPLPGEIEEELDAAAAARPAAGGGGLTAEVQVFASKMRAVPAFRAISFEVTDDKLAAIHDLVVLHGDQRLIDTALRSAFDPVPSFASAFLKKWRALPQPGQTLQLVEEPRCPCGLTIAACDRKNTKLAEEHRCHERETA
jgi:hypothetical protein